MTKTKRLSVRLGVLLLAVLIGLGGFAATQASADDAPAASYVGFRNVGQDWRGKYGSDGYLVFSGTPDNTSGSYVYTDLYGDEYTEAFTGSRPSSKLFSAADSNLTYTGDSSAAPAIADDAPVSDWGVTSETLQWHNDMRNSALLNPDGENTNLRMHNTRDVKNQSVSVYFTAKAAGYVTVYAYSYSKYAGSSTMTVSLYAGNNKETIFPAKSVSQDNVAAADADTVEAQLTAQLTETFESYDIDTYYGGTSGAPLATVPITLRSDNNLVVGRYVTFYVETPGQYQIVAYRADSGYTFSRNSGYVDGGTLTVTANPASGIAPSIGGVFFDAADPTVTTASYTGQRDIGQNWVGEYGGEGYILLSGSTDGTMDTSGRYFYSDLYGVEYTGAFTSTRHNNYMSTANNNVIYNGEAAPALSADAPISDWGMTSETYQGHNDTGTTALTLPDGVTTTRLRMNNTQDSLNQSVSMYFRLKTPGYVSAYVYSFSANAGDIDVALYAGNQTSKLEITKNVTSSEAVTEATYDDVLAELTATLESRIAALSDPDVFYGGTPLAETTVAMPAGRVPGRMVTFYISEPGDYQIVAYHTDPDYRIVPDSSWTDGNTLRVAGEPASGTPAPSIGGLFFDSYDRSKIASFSSSDTETNGYWEDMYGKDGYILFGVDDTTVAGDPYSTTERIAYAKGIYATDGKVTMDDDTLETGNTSDGAQEFGIVEDYAMTNAFVSRYGAFYQTWDWKTWLEPDNAGYNETAAKMIAGDGQLKLPGNPDDYIRGRMILSADGRPGSIAFTLTEDAFASHDVVYVSAYHNQVADGFTDVGDVKFVSRLYNTYLSTDDLNTWAEYEPVAETEIVRAGGNGGLYVTYAITQPGDYSIYLLGTYLDGDNAEQYVRGSIEGLFFDYADPTDTEITRYDIEYVLPDGAMNGANPATYVAGRGVSSFAPASMPGYTFVGWFDAETEGSQVTSISSESTGDKTLYARFTPNPVRNITYVVTNGTNAASNPATYTEGIAVTFADPTPNAHYTFAGWFTEAGGQGEQVTGIPADSTGDVTVYAHFVESANYAIEYVLPDGAANDPTNPTRYYTGEGVASFAPATMDGYTFLGWYADETFDTEIGSIPPTMNRAVTLYARFEKNPVVSDIVYHLDSGTNASSNPATYTEGTAVVLADAEKEGYTFLGWYTSADFAEGTKVTGISADSTGTVTLYARFEKNPVVSDIVYHLDGGANASANPATYTEGTAVTLADAEKEGYTFLGWYTSADFAEGTKVTEISADSTGDVELWARFEAETPVDPGDDDDDPSTDPGDDDNDPTTPGGDDTADDGCGCGGALGFGTGAGAAALLLSAGAAFLLFRRRKA